MKFHAYDCALFPQRHLLHQTWLVMRLTAFFLLIAALHVSAKTLSQNVSISGKDLSLKQILRIIKHQTGYEYIGDQTAILNAPRMSVDFNKAPLPQVLDKCLASNGFNYEIIDKTIVVKLTSARPAPPGLPRPDASADSLRMPVPGPVRGVVKDSAGTTVEGVTVLLTGEGFSRGIATDGQGRFVFADVPNGYYTLEVSSIGYGRYTRRIIVSNGMPVLTVLLQRTVASLEETVVVGYGTQKKLDLTGSVDQISGDMLKNRPVTTVADALQGMMANLNVSTGYSGGSPDATKSLNVRGFTGFSSGGNSTSGAPLVLVDGVEADINTININDIESVSLLKDAASSAIYGSRAPNGVLLITTRQGKKNQPVHLSYSGNFSTSQPINVPKMMNSLDWANAMNEAYTNDGVSALIPASVITRIQAYMKDPKNTPTTIADPSSGGTQWADYDPTFGNANNDWFKVYLKKWSSSQQHNISMDGGSDRITYFLGLGYTDKNGLYNYYSDSYNHYNIRLNVTATVNKYVTVGIKSSYAQANDNAPQAPYPGATTDTWFYSLARTWPIVPLLDPNGGYDVQSYATKMQQGGSLTSQNNDSWLTGEVTIKPLEGWNIIGDYSYNYQAYNSLSSILPYPYATVADPNTLKSVVSSVTKEYMLTNYHTYNLFTSYEKNISGHYFKVLVGQQEEYKANSELTGSNQDLYNLSQPSLSLTSGPTPSASDGGYGWATYGTFGRINYNYKEKYLLEFNGRYMGSSLFPDSTRYHFFSSVSGGWNVSREAFFQPLDKWIGNLKFRASYGGLGDLSYFLNNGSYYPYLANLGTNAPTSTGWFFSPNGTRQPSVSAPTSLPSPTLTWAKPSMLDLGVDVDFLKQFSATFDWYRRKITDQFGPSAEYPAPLGIAPPTENNATSETTGFDLTVTWKHRFGSVNVNARALVSSYHGKIISYTGNPTDLLTDWYNGEKMGAIWGFRTVGKFQSQQQVSTAPVQTAISANWYPGDIQYADLNHDGKIDFGNNTVQNPGDQTIIGNTTPKYTYGFNAGASWKGFDLFVFIQGSSRTDYSPPSSNNLFWGITGEYGSTLMTTQADRWTAANPNGYFPRLEINDYSKNRESQTGYLLNAAYMRLKNLQIGYTIPENKIKKTHIGQLRFYGSAENIFTVSPAMKHQFVDPELLQSNELIYPLQRTFSVGCQLSIQ
jgi:TonB-linked SusC/RagA family outer membrane protein